MSLKIAQAKIFFQGMKLIPTNKCILHPDKKKSPEVVILGSSKSTDAWLGLFQNIHFLKKLKVIEI